MVESGLAKDETHILINVKASDIFNSTDDN